MTQPVRPIRLHRFALSGHCQRVEWLLHLIPTTFFSALADGELLQVLVIAILTGFACARLGPFGDRVADGLEAAGKVFFSIIHIVVRAAPVGAFGAMAFTIGRYGVQALGDLGLLILTFYVTSILFVVVVLAMTLLQVRLGEKRTHYA